VARECARFGIWLTDEHLHAVSCHHGGWASLLSSVHTFVRGPLSPLATIVHCADLCSANILGDRR
jgi:hypothetical protein